MESKRIRQHLQCPICFEITDGKIFQCISGHHICEGCIKKCPRCPQCNVEYGMDKIRSLQLEAIRDDLEERCPNEERGCLEKIQRKNLPSHQNECAFRLIKFCRMLGFGNCLKEASTDIPSLIAHLEGIHLIKKYNHFGNEFEWTRFYRSSLANLQRKPELKTGFVALPNCNVLFQLEAPKPESFLVCKITNNRYLSLLCLHLGSSSEDAGKYQLQCIISNGDINKFDRYEIKWTAAVFNFREFDKLLKKPPRTPMSLAFLQDIPGDSLFCRCTIVPVAK